MITICIPIYRSDPELLALAIDSVIAQTCKQWQLMLIDGGVEPNAYAQQMADGNKITYCRNNSDRSMAGNWNACLAAAQTDLVVLLHDDDQLHATYIEHMFQLAQAHPTASLLFCDVTVINSAGEPTSTMADRVKGLLRPQATQFTLSGDKGAACLMRGCFIFCPSILYRKSQLRGISFSSNWKMVTDLDFYIALLLAGGTLIGTDQKLFFYRRHCQNQTVILSQNAQRFAEEHQFYQLAAQRFIENGFSRSARVSRQRIIVRLHMIFYALFKARDWKVRNQLVRWALG